MSWRPWLEDRALRQMQGLPSEAFDMLVRTLARICDDPYDPVSGDSDGVRNTTCYHGLHGDEAIQHQREGRGP